VASQIVSDLVWNPKLENMQTVIIENILKELNAENESRQGPQGLLRFKFVGARCDSRAGSCRPSLRRPALSLPALAAATVIPRRLTFSLAPCCAVLCELQQNSGAGLANACTCYWDNTTDGALARAPVTMTRCHARHIPNGCYLHTAAPGRAQVIMPTSTRQSTSRHSWLSMACWSEESGVGERWWVGAGAAKETEEADSRAIVALWKVARATERTRRAGVAAGCSKRNSASQRGVRVRNP
jgi:hypothetical protein